MRVSPSRQALRFRDARGPYISVLSPAVVSFVGLSAGATRCRLVFHFLFVVRRRGGWRAGNGT